MDWSWVSTIDVTCAFGKLYPELNGILGPTTGVTRGNSPFARLRALKCRNLRFKLMPVSTRHAIATCTLTRVGISLPRGSHVFSSHLPPTSTMASISHRPEGRDVVLPTLDVFIQALNIAKDACGIPHAQIALGSAGTLLTMIRVHFPHSSAKKDGRLTSI